MAVLAPKDGYVSSIQTEQVGWASVKIGVGRTKTTDPVDSAAGIEWLKPIGHKVLEGEPMAYVYSSSDSKLIEASNMLVEAIEIAESNTGIKADPLVAKYISSL